MAFLRVTKKERSIYETPATSKAVITFSGRWELRIGNRVGGAMLY